jgi:hypothetical protein
MLLYDPATITPDDVAALEHHGCTRAGVFNLVLGAASAAALLRLDAGCVRCRYTIPRVGMAACLAKCLMRALLSPR